MLETSSKVLRDAVRLAASIVQPAFSSRCKLLERHSEGYVRRALHFLKQVAEREKVTGIRDQPGTPSSMLLFIVKQHLHHYDGLVGLHDTRTLIMRSIRMRKTRDELFRSSRKLRDVVLSAQKGLGLSRIGRLHQAAVDPRARNRPHSIDIVPIADALRDHLELPPQHPVVDEDDSATGFPDVATYLQLAIFLRMLRTPQDIRLNSKRRREQLDNGNQEDGASDSNALGPTLIESMPESSSAACKAASELLEDLTASRLAFDGLGQLQRWRQRAASRLRTVTLLWNRNSETFGLSFSETATMLVSLSILLFQTHFFEAAAYSAELLVATLREDYEQEPSKAKQVRLVSGLGLLSMLLAQAESRGLEAMRAGEEALSLLQPLHEADPAEYLPLAIVLKFAYSRSLCSSARKERGMLMKLCLFRRSVRVAQQAVDLARSTVKAEINNVEAREALAAALSLKGDACHTLSYICADLEDSLETRRSEAEMAHSGQNPSDAQGPIPVVHLKIRRKIDDQSCGDLDEAGHSYEECISIYQQLAKDVPRLYDYPLALTMETTADLYHPIAEPKSKSKNEKAIAYYGQAIAIYRRLFQSFPHLFDRGLHAVYYDLGSRLRWENRLVDADLAFQESLHFLSELGDPTGAVGFDVLQARAHICVRLERYEEALVHGTKSIAISRHEAAMSQNHWEAFAVQEFCKWVLKKEARPTQTLHALESAVALAISQRNPLEYTSMQDCYICLALGWLGAVQCSVGQQEDATKNGAEAVRLMLDFMDSKEAREGADQELEPYEHMLPHLLVLLAGTHLEAGRHDEAKKVLDESLKVGDAADGPTRKTALLLRARFLDTDGLEAEAAAIRAEADRIPFKGFLEVLCC
ncbi:unnamed protein product [Tilletia controversa]|nr:unnamed protein product [Tilletia controversa]